MKFDNLYFGARSEAEMVLDELQDIARTYGNVTLMDYYDMALKLKWKSSPIIFLLISQN